MKKLIPLINTLQDVFNTIGGELVELPQIAVVGCQSSGKSSVLEAVVGKDFLPRGSGIVTRRPLVLQLVHANPGEEQYAEFLHKKGEKFKNFDAMRQEIIDETERECPTNRAVSPKPINLRIQSPNVPNLTLVDLPGLTKVAIEGQDPRIVEQIHMMVRNYVAPSHTLILAITPANQDIANSDSLKMAREVDPDGTRTIGVITKLDLMDAGTDAGAILRNEVYPLRLGYIAVVNRSQKDIDARKKMADALQAEQQFFAQHAVYRPLSDRTGTAVLSVTLNRILIEHIKRELPALRTRVEELIKDKERELERYGEDPAGSPMNAHQLVVSIITTYCTKFSDLIAGKVGDQVEDDLKGGARISRIFKDVFEREIKDAPALSSNDSGLCREVWWMMRNHSGITVPIFVSHQAFESVVRRRIENLRFPALKAVNLVSNEILNIHAQVHFPDLERYPQVKDAIRNEVEDLVNSCVEPTNQFVNDVIDNEKQFINTARHDFRGAAVLAEKKQKDQVPQKLTSKQIEQQNVKTLVNLCARYFELVRLQVVDIIPKAIVMMLVEGSTTKLQNVLVQKICGSGIAEDIMKEDPRITQLRRKCMELLGALRQARTLLNEVRSFSL
jgi:dynamin 1-like protein